MRRLVSGCLSYEADGATGDGVVSMQGSGCGGRPERGGADRLGGALLVEDVELGDREPRAGDEIGDRAGEVASAEQALLDRLEAVLPAPDRLVGGESVLEEVERPARLEHPADLAQGGGDVGNGAQGERGQGGVAAVVGQGERSGRRAPSGRRGRRRRRGACRPASSRCRPVRWRRRR